MLRIACCICSIAMILSAPGHGDSWRIVGSTNDVRESTGLALLDDGRVLIASGHPATRGKDSRWRVIGSAEIFDPTTETWGLTGSLVEPRNGVHELARLADGTILLSGEHDTKTGAEIFDPKAGVWKPTAPLHVGRGVHTTTVLGDGRVLVAGGIDYSRDPGIVLADAELYNPATQSWTITSRMHTPRFTHAAVLLNDGHVLVVGGAASDVPGAGGLASAELFDSATGAWSETLPMAQARKIPSATRLRDGRVFVAGGVAGNGPAQESISTAEIYDPATRRWMAAASMTEDRVQFPLVTLPDGRVMAIAGVGRPRGTALNGVEIYDPTRDAWSVAEPLQVRRWNHRAVVLSSGDVLVVGGFNMTGELLSTEIFSLR